MVQPMTTEAQRPAFDAIYEEYHGPLLRYARSHLRGVDDETVNDLVADAWLKIYEKMPTMWEDRSLPVGAWLYKLMRNAIIDWIRARKGRQVVAFDAETHDVIDEDGEHEYLGVLSTEIIETVLAALSGRRGEPTRQSEIIRLVYVEGWRLTDVAQHYGETLDASQKMHRRALGRVRTFLETGATRRKRRSRVA